MDSLLPYEKYLTGGFKFSQSFIEYVTSKNPADLDPWWFFNQSEKYIEYWCSTIKKLYPTRNLIPFANWIYSDDIVCFDGSDKSGDPKVFFVHAFASSGWEGQGSTDNFDSWLKIAKEESAQYKVERIEAKED